jgi:hypothetical protein
VHKNLLPCEFREVSLASVIFGEGEVKVKPGVAQRVLGS